MNSIDEISSQGGSNASLPDTDGDISNDVINFMDDDSAAFEAQSAASSDHGHFLFDLELLPEDIQLEAEDDLEANNEDDSSGTLMSVYSLEVPHPLNEPAPPNPIQAGVNHFLQQHPACQLITMPLGAFFDVIDVPADGHCAYHCFMGWLSFFGTPFLRTLAMFRNAIYIHLSRNLSADVNERPYRDAAGEVLPDFRGLRRSVIGEVGRAIWNRQVDFSLPVGVAYYCDVFKHMPIISQFLRRDIVIYNTEDVTTTFFVFDMETDNVKVLIYNEG